MPDVLGGVHRLGHGAHDHLGEQPLLLGAAHLPQQPVDGVWQVLLLLAHQGMAEALRQGPQLGDPLLVGMVVHPVHERMGAPFFQPGNPGGHTLVGQQHELLDQPVGLVHDLLVDLQRPPLLVQTELHLGGHDLQGALRKPVLPQHPGQGVQGTHLVTEGALGPIDGLLGLRIGEPSPGADHRAPEPFVLDAGLLIQVEDGRERQLVLIGIERAEVVAEPLRKHGHHAVHQVHRRGAGNGLLVHAGAGLHIVRHVRDVYAHFPQAVVQLPDAERVVQVLRVLRVDGQRRNFPHVTTLGVLRSAPVIPDRSGGPDHILGKVMRKPEFRQDGVHLHIVLARAPEHVHDPSARQVPRVAPVAQLHHHLVAFPGLGRVHCRHEEGLVDARVVHHHEQAPLLPVYHTHVRGAPPLHHLQHLAFRSAATPAPQLDLHPVAMKGQPQVALLDEHVTATLLGAQEPRPTADDLKGPGQDAGPIRAVVPALLSAGQAPLLQQDVQGIEDQVAPAFVLDPQTKGDLLGGDAGPAGLTHDGQHVLHDLTGVVLVVVLARHAGVGEGPDEWRSEDRRMLRGWVHQRSLITRSLLPLQPFPRRGCTKAPRYSAAQPRDTSRRRSLRTPANGSARSM